ncbi:hypothetical protein FRC17_009964 [Serendipita sp. 399]|nr:hypothetical protein FRC17_009964 [Serendipita sp. 399]
MPTTSQIITISTVAVVLGIAGYAVYFDYVRRNDPQFRKRLRKEKKRVDRSNSSIKAAAASAKGLPTDAELDAALQLVRDENLPATPEEKEQYFMQNLAIGEQLSTQGLALPAALAFFRAMRVYPEPMQLVMILEKTLPDDMFRIVMELMSRDVSGPSSSTVNEDVSSSAAGRRPKRSGRTGTSSRSPPSETSSQEWDRLTEPDASVASLSSSTS